MSGELNPQEFRELVVDAYLTDPIPPITCMTDKALRKLEELLRLRYDAQRKQVAAAMPQETITPEPVHPDDLAVDRFAAAMKAKLAASRAKGRGGWDDPAQCTVEHLARLLVDHIPKGDAVDVANFAMMLHQRGADRSVLAALAQPAQEGKVDESAQAEFNRAIDFAIKEGIGAAIFLDAWRHGDTSEWPEFEADQPAAQATPEPANPYGTGGSMAEAWRRGYNGERCIAYAGSDYDRAWREGRAAQQATPDPSLLKTFLAEADRAGITHLPPTFAADLAAATASTQEAAGEPAVSELPRAAREEWEKVVHVAAQVASTSMVPVKAHALRAVAAALAASQAKGGAA